MMAGENYDRSDIENSELWPQHLRCFGWHLSQMEEQQRSQRDVKLIQKYTIPDKDPLAADFFDHDHVLDPVTLNLF